MPRTVWSGAISFGLVTVPIHVVSAVEDHSIHFHRVHLADMARVRTRKVCELEGREVSTAEIGKGYESPATTSSPSPTRSSSTTSTRTTTARPGSWNATPSTAGSRP